jgi:integrase
MQKMKTLGIAIEPLPRFNRHAFTNAAELTAARKDHATKLRDRRKQLNQLARQHGPSLAAYDIRHGFCQRMLESGADHLTVAELMGHANGQMVSTVYSHMNRASTHLKEALKKGAGS